MASRDRRREDRTRCLSGREGLTGIGGTHFAVAYQPSLSTRFDSQHEPIRPGGQHERQDQGRTGAFAA